MMATRELMTKLISFQPVSADVDKVNELVDFLHGYLEGNGVHTALEQLGDRKILYAATHPGKTSRILLNSHLDVVPADKKMFTVTQDGDWLCGRGTHDCLGNTALLARLLVQLNNEADIGAVFSTDEELGGETTRFMVERGYSARELVLVVDGSGNSLVTAQKGVLSLTMRARGQGCHAAKPWEGHNAIDALIDGYQKIRPLFPDVAPPDTWRDTMAATTIQAGTVHNRVPETAEMSLNIRVIEGTEADELLERLRKLSGLEIDVNMQCPPVFCPPDNPRLKALRETMAAHLGREIMIKRSNGATDARHFVDMGVPIGIIGVPGRDLHGDNEALSARGLQDYEALLLDFLQAAPHSW